MARDRKMALSKTFPATQTTINEPKDFDLLLRSEEKLEKDISAYWFWLVGDLLVYFSLEAPGGLKPRRVFRDLKNPFWGGEEGLLRNQSG